ncbi:hypothetical protein EJD97_008006 [Solanum chilense]|uniref:Uncharacterized protein n=1 Tax=Solanum chilense TaxID=4083 RepID=A0A6N2BTJ9_SOLCI|nr:hypothetical protein EJD97_008006 [Solanum chilense]
MIFICSLGAFCYIGIKMVVDYLISSWPYCNISKKIHFLSEEVWVDKESSDYFFCRYKVPAMFHCKDSKVATRL